MLDLLGNPAAPVVASDAHDPGGKLKLPIPPGVRGSAQFYGPRSEHRTILWREWGETYAPYPLWIGMNPSVADAMRYDDMTIRVECGFTRRWGYTRYAKANVMSLRATYPKDLLEPGAAVACHQNLDDIAHLAAGAEFVVFTFGWLPPSLRGYAKEAILVCARLGLPMLCLGTSKDGSPRHVRGLPTTAERIPFPVAGMAYAELFR